MMGTVMTGKTRTSPTVDEVLLSDLKTTIRAFNDDKVKGRLSPAVEEAMKLYIAVEFLRSPLRLKRLDEYTSVEDPDVRRERIYEYINEMSEPLDEAVQMMEQNPQFNSQDSELDDSMAAITQLAQALEGDDFDNEETRRRAKQVLDATKGSNSF
jgi:hypothetical protein